MSFIVALAVALAQKKPLAMKTSTRAEPILDSFGMATYMGFKGAVFAIDREQ